MIDSTTLERHRVLAEAAESAAREYESAVAEAERLKVVADEALSAYLAVANARPQPRTRYTHVTPELLAQVVQIYNAAPGFPTRAVSTHFNKPYSTCARWVMEARRRGMLPATTQGVGARG